MNSFRELPASVERIDVARLLSQTSLSRALQRRLVATGRPDERLPPDPRAILGTVFHRLAELSVKGQLDPAADPSSAVRNTLNRLLSDKGRELEVTDLAHCIPLAHTITHPEFLDRRARAIWNATRHLCALPHTFSATHAPKDTGAERQMASEQLRLAGRIHLVERDAI